MRGAKIERVLKVDISFVSDSFLFEDHRSDNDTSQ